MDIQKLEERLAALTVKVAILSLTLTGIEEEFAALELRFKSKPIAKPPNSKKESK